MRDGGTGDGATRWWERPGWGLGRCRLVMCRGLGGAKQHGHAGREGLVEAPAVPKQCVAGIPWGLSDTVSLRALAFVHPAFISDAVEQQEAGAMLLPVGHTSR